MWSHSTSFSEWADRTHQQLIARQGADVPCGSCTACCKAGQFIHVSESEAAYRAIPAELLVPAPGTSGEFLLGHDQSGRCPMLKDERCTIYEDRPLSCRTYDCRIFSGAGVYPQATQPEIASRAMEWAFDYPGEVDKTMHQAMINAAAFLSYHQQILFGGPVNEIQLSLSALKTRHLFAIASDERTHEQPYDPATEPAEHLDAVKAALQP